MGERFYYPYYSVRDTYGPPGLEEELLLAREDLLRE